MRVSRFSRARLGRARHILLEDRAGDTDVDDVRNADPRFDQPGAPPGPACAAEGAAGLIDQLRQGSFAKDQTSMFIHADGAAASRGAA